MKSRVFTAALIPIICLATISMANTREIEAITPTSRSTTEGDLLAGNCNSCSQKRVGPIRRFERWKWSKIRGLVRRGSC
ncbi:MAG: hypothetical protein AAGG44_04020 [Planctomycetota bacterium]